MSLKLHPYAKNETVEFDGYKLMKSEIDRLAEVIDRINIRVHSRQNQQNKP